MSTIADRVWHDYHLHTVHADHPLRLLCEEARRLEAELEQMRALAEQNGQERDTARARFGAGPDSTTSERTWNDADHA